MRLICDKPKQTIRQKVVPILMRKGKSNILPEREKKALNTLEMDDNIIILSADKGRGTINLDKADRIQKAKELLQDMTA